MLKLTGVRKNYPGFTLDCTMEVESGRITGLIGPNGAGKTTVFKAVLGLIGTDGGAIELFGRGAGEATAEDRLMIGAVLAESGFSGYLTVGDVLRILRAFYPGFREDFFREKCEAFGLTGNKPIRDFSTGMKAKLKVLAAVSRPSRLLILDEPTAGLDVLARDRTLDLLRDYMAEDEERAILISSHISNDLESLCDDFYLISDGRIVCHEETDRLLSDYGILKPDGPALETLDRRYLLRALKEAHGCRLLTDQRRYYAENYPGLVVEKASMDDYLTLMLKGEAI